MSRKRIRVYCPFMPYPITEGAYQIMFDQVRVLSVANDVELITWKESSQQIARKLRENDPFDGRVKIVCWGDSQSQRESQWARGWRTLQSLFKKIPSPAAYYYSENFDRRDELEPCDLEIYHYSYAWNWLKRETKSKTIQRVLHLHNIESDLFELRAKKETSRTYKWIHRLNARKLRAIEAKLTLFADQVWFVSQPDLDSFQSRFGIDPQKALVKPPSYSKELYEMRRSRFLEFEKKSNSKMVRLGFVGTLDFDPNIMSLEWILDNICPRLKEKNWHGELVVVGRNPSERLKAKMAQYPFIKFLGFVHDMEKFWECLSLFLLPHVEGSGVRVKLLDSLASGVPVLANQAATDRIDIKVLGSDLLYIHEQPVKWIELIESLQNAELRREKTDFAIAPALLGENVYREYL